jgi:hypothetical protein
MRTNGDFLRARSDHKTVGVILTGAVLQAKGRISRSRQDHAPRNRTPSPLYLFCAEAVCAGPRSPMPPIASPESTNSTRRFC